jgi:hypothetical protein
MATCAIFTRPIQPTAESTTEKTSLQMTCAVVAMVEPQRTHVQLSAKNTHVKAQHHQFHQLMKNARIKMSSIKTRIERMIGARSTGRIQSGVDSTMTMILPPTTFAAPVVVAQRTVILLQHLTQTFASTQPQKEQKTAMVITVTTTK